MWFGRKLKSPPPARSDRPLVLIVDDEEDLCRILSVALQAAGFAVETAHDGLAGLEKARRLRPRAILLDIKMPRMNGFHALAQIQQDAALAATPVIVMTILDEAAQVSPDEWTRRLNVRGYLQKPFSPEQAVEMVRRALDTPSATGA